MPEYTDEERKVVKDRVKYVTDFLKDNQDMLLVYPEILGSVEDAIDNVKRKMELQPGEFKAPEKASEK